MGRFTIIRQSDRAFEIVLRAKVAISQCNWFVGRCASEWLRDRYTDAEFAATVGLETEQVVQRRIVWERFGNVQDQYPHLQWSHFYAALKWDDAAKVLHWADENEATVAEMKAWRRMQRGEDLAASEEE